MSDANRITLETFWNSINCRDVEGYLATFAEDAVAHDPYGAPPLSSDADRRAYIEGLLGSLAELKASIEFRCSRSDMSAVKWRVSAKSADGEDVHLEGIDVYRHANDGRISEMWGFFET